MLASTQIVLRWAARIIGLLLVGLVIALVVGEGPPNVFRQPPPVTIEFMAMGLMLTGLLLGWRWEALGGLATIVGFAVFAATELVVNRRLPGGAFWLFVATGLLLLASSGWKRLHP